MTWKQKAPSWVFWVLCLVAAYLALIIATNWGPPRMNEAKRINPGGTDEPPAPSAEP